MGTEARTRIQTVAAYVCSPKRARRAATLLVVSLAVAGCAGIPAPSGASPWTPEAECDRNAGVWRPAHNYCEPQFARLAVP